jgi:autotransporter-associated beta strand protein
MGSMRRSVPFGAGNNVYLEGNVSTLATSQSARLEGEFILTGGAARVFNIGNGTAGDDLVVLSVLQSLGGTGLTKTGAGRMVIETNSGYIGNTTVSAGTLIMNGANLATDVLLNGGTFGGVGSVGAISGPSGTLAPGESPGILTATNLQLLAGNTFSAEIYGSLVGSEYDRLNVNGSVTLGGSLSVTLGAGASQVGNVFRIISNDGVDAITGTFAGLAEGATVIIGGYRFRISYVGGINNNDVTLTRLAHVNITSNNIPNSGQASVYPSTINIAGMTGLVSRVTVTLSNFSHTFPDDVDVLLVSPAGKKVLLMSDVGGSIDVTNLDLTIADSAADFMPDAGPLVSGIYRPSNISSGDIFNAPAPPGPYATDMFAFVGDSPNGAWSLYVMDDVGGDSGSFAGGWSLDIAVGPPLEITRLSGTRVMLSWPDYAVGFTVETAPYVTNAVWSPLGITPIATAGEFRVTNTMNPTNLFYRLVK